MASPDVTVCIPAYRAEAYLGVAVESVLAQTYQDWELAIVDNASPDRSGEIARAFDDPRISVYTNSQTLPMAENWNRAVSKAHGRYVKLLPADDMIHPDCLELQVKDLDSHPGAALISCRRDFIDADGRIVATGRGLSGLVGEHAPTRVVREVFRSGINPVGDTAAFLFRRDDFIAAGGFDSSFSYPLDLALAIRLLERGYLYGQAQSLAAFRIRGDSHTAGDVRAQNVEHRRLLRRAANDDQWAISAYQLWQGLARTYPAGIKRALLYRAINSRFSAVRQLPNRVLSVTARRDDRATQGPELI